MIRSSLEDGELACVLVPQGGPWPLLLPNVCVAEILRNGSSQPRHDSPVWLLGDLDWRQQHLPLLSFDLLSEFGDADAPVPGSEGQHRSIVVLNRTRTSSALPFYAITSTATPRLIRVSQEDLQPARIDVPFNPELGLPVIVLGEEAMVPNLAYLEAILAGFVVH